MGFGVGVQGLGALLSCARCDDAVHVAWLQEGRVAEDVPEGELAEENDSQEGGAAAAGGSSRTSHGHRREAKRRRTAGAHGGSPREGRPAGGAAAGGGYRDTMFSPPASTLGGPGRQSMSMAKSMAYLCEQKAINMDPKYRKREMQLEAYRLETDRRQVCL